MNCKKCGKKVSKTDVFCQYCGTKVEQEESKAKTTKSSTKKEEKKVEVVKTTPVETKKEGGNGLAIASMVLGIIGILFSLIIGPFAFLFPLLGLIFALCSKKSGFKIAGLVTSIVAFVIEIIITILSIFVFSTLFSIFGNYIDDYDYDYDYDYNYNYKNETPYGEWECVPYPSYSANPEKTTLNLKYSGRYVYGPSDDLLDNYYSGKFTYTSEYEKNLDYTDRKFLDIKADVDEFKLDGISQSTYGKNLNMEMQLIDDYDTAIIMFYNTSSTYKCER